VEITCLLVTDENDSEDEVRALVDWAASVSPDLPLHLSAYRPAYKCEAPATPIERLARAVEIAREKLNYVYAGNVMIPGGDDTVCLHHYQSADSRRALREMRRANQCRCLRASTVRACASGPATG